jgi:hypothetical protein
VYASRGGLLCGLSRWVIGLVDGVPGVTQSFVLYVPMIMSLVRR